jgi:hypothetical protein
MKNNEYIYFINFCLIYLFGRCNSIQSEKNEEFINYLKKNIKILNNSKLLNDVYLYCKELKNYHKANKESHIKQGIIKDINMELSKLKTKNNVNNVNNVNNINNVNNVNNENNENNVKIINQNNKIIKKHPLKASGLIESIINCTLYYYSSDSTVKCTLDIDSNKFLQIMNRANGILLSEYILQLYNNNKIDVNHKNIILLNILKNIAIKLKFLQEKCHFIHGDLHSANIFINISRNNKIDIKFIDFERSTIKFPYETNLLINGVSDELLNSKYQLDLDENNSLKGIDLFHLIENLKSYKLNNKINKNPNLIPYFELINMIGEIYNKKYNQKLIKKYGSVHILTTSSDIYSVLNILVPDNFIKNIDMLLNNNNNHNNNNNNNNNF